MTSPTTEPTTQLEKKDRCNDLPHRPRVLLGKMGLDGHDRGVKLIARALQRQRHSCHLFWSLADTTQPRNLSARDEDVDMIACSMMSNSHLVLSSKRLMEELSSVGRPTLFNSRCWRNHSTRRRIKPLLDCGVRRRVSHRNKHA